MSRQYNGISVIWTDGLNLIEILLLSLITANILRSMHSDQKDIIAFFLIRIWKLTFLCDLFQYLFRYSLHIPFELVIHAIPEMHWLYNIAKIWIPFYTSAPM